MATHLKVVTPDHTAPLFPQMPQVGDPEAHDADGGKTHRATDAPWKIAIVDDDKSVHSVSRMVLGELRFKGRRVQILDEYTGEGAKNLLRAQPDIAVILLDVVMESDHAGLDVVKYVRETLNNGMVRIILRTGQPGQAPENKVISDYDINDYKEKSDLTAQKLITAVTAALRGYDDLLTIQSLSNSKETLEKMVEERTSELAEVNQSLREEMEDRLKVLETLRRNQALLAEAQEIANVGNYEWNVATGDMIWSDQINRILGVAADSVVPSVESLLRTVPEDDRARVESEMRAAVAACRSFDVEHPIVRHDGRRGFVRQQGEVQCDANGAAQRLIGIMQDITEQHASAEVMRKLSAAVEQTADAILITDREGAIEYVNAAFTKLTGYEADEVMGTTPRMLKSGKQPDVFYRRLWHAISQGEVFSDILVNRRKDGSLYYEAKTITPQRDKFGHITHFISTGKDVTDQMLAQERIQYLAHHDALTGLPNRALLMDRLEQSLARSKRHNRHVAVLFLDMDRFKVINDTLGHGTGDELLKQMANRLTACVREGDTVARLGGDEFAIVLNDIAAREDVTNTAQKVLDSVRNHFVLEGRELFVTTSIGISVYPADGEDGQVLLKRADVAMYNAKSIGKNNFQFYTDRDEKRELERLGMESDLRRALDREEFFLAYQPLVNSVSRSILGMEALLRWKHPDGRIVPPFDFIPLLEETGMIVDVGDWVMHAACTEAQAMRLAGLPPMRVAVNISAHQFRKKGFVQRVQDILARTGLDPELLDLEITEGVLVDDVKGTAKVLDDLHMLGVHLSIDDFGTGYSSMHYLRRLPFDTLKIDKSFIKDVPGSKDNDAIVTAIITLAHSMELDMVAEGVETRAQFDFVKDLGCQSIQGYLFSPPVSPEEFKSLVRKKEFLEKIAAVH